MYQDVSASVVLIFVCWGVVCLFLFWDSLTKCRPKAVVYFDPTQLTVQSKW